MHVQHVALTTVDGHTKCKIMAPQHPQEKDSRLPILYQIRIRGHLGHQWTDWFDGLSITREENGDTLITGPVVDQSALYGLLKKVRDIGMPLLSLNPCECEPDPDSRQNI